MSTGCCRRGLHPIPNRPLLHFQIVVGLPPVFKYSFSSCESTLYVIGEIVLGLSFDLLRPGRSLSREFQGWAPRLLFEDMITMYRVSPGALWCLRSCC
jgi:hypothetical protein